MLFRTHFLFGLLIFFILSPHTSIPTLLFLCSILLGVAIVDIDTKKSKLGRKKLFRPIQFFVSHRGIFHSFFSALILSLLLYFFFKDFATGFFIGYLSHLFLDTLTKTGTPLFWPLTHKHTKFFIQTGGLLEDILFLFLLTLNIHFSLSSFF